MAVTNAKRGASAIPGAPAGGNGQVFNIGAVPLVAGVPQTLDLTNAKIASGLDAVRGCKLDNTANGTPAVIVSSAGDLIYAPPYAMAQGPLASPQDVFTFQLSGSGNVAVVLFNFQVPALVTNNASTAVPQSGGVVPVSDANLEATISGTTLRTSTWRLGNGDVLVPDRPGNGVFSGTVTATGNTTLITGSPAFYLTGLFLGLTPDATLAAAGALTVSVQRTSDSKVLFSRKALLPAAAPTPAGPVAGTDLANLSGLQWVGAPAGDNLQLTLSAALATGALYWTALGGLTATGG